MMVAAQVTSRNEQSPPDTTSSPDTGLRSSLFPWDVEGESWIQGSAARRVFSRSEGRGLLCSAGQELGGCR